GAGAFRFQSTAVVRPIDVFYYVPRDVMPSTPIVFALHGANRNARGMRDNWIPKADQFGLVILAPRFDEATFPGGSGYILGNVFDNGNEPGGAAPKPQREWSFSYLEPLFDEAKRRLSSTVETYELFGHSGGAQFAHRFIYFVPASRARRIVAANAGWYTVPDSSVAFPYGLGGAPVASTSSLWFGRSLTVLLGDEDTDPGSAGLRHTPEADAQGQHRFERGQFFFRRSEEVARDEGQPSSWNLEVTPGVGHDARLMSLRAADLLFR
ncbi:MAG: alpha/beta hydrolase, partial [Myxococcota bacterium]